MIKINLQLFGGRGASSGGEGWTGGGGGGEITVFGTTSLISARETKQLEVDETLQTFKDMHDEYGYVVDDLQLAVLSDNSTLAYYDGANIAFNETFFNKQLMETAYANDVKIRHHPSQGNKTALQAVASHEIGHALTDKAIAKMGGKYGKHDGAEAILKEAQKQVGHRGKLAKMAGKISVYATFNARECIAEACADVYCNGKRATKESQAIVNVMNKYLK